MSCYNAVAYEGAIDEAVGAHHASYQGGGGVTAVGGRSAAIETVADQRAYHDCRQHSGTSCASQDLQ
jgi:hypothetical protein